MVSFFINFLLNTISESHLGAQILIVGGIIVIVGLVTAKLIKVLPQWYAQAKEFILNREHKREERESTQQQILRNQDSILNNYRNVETLTQSVSDIAKLTNKISDEYRQIGAIVETLLSRLDSLEVEVPELRNISDKRDNELINTISSQTATLSEINTRIDQLTKLVGLLTESDTETFRHKLLGIYEETLTNGHKIELHTYQDLYKGFHRYIQQGGNSYAKEIWNEISKCEKVMNYPELYSEEYSEELAPDAINLHKQ